MTERIVAAPLTAAAFAPFGQVLETAGPPDRIINRGLCGRWHDLARLDFEIGLAEAGYAGRALSLPRALGLSLRSRRPAVLATALKYLFDGPYLRWRRLRRGDA